MRIRYPAAGKAVKQIERRDARGADQYRAELKYFHYKPRVVLGLPAESKAQFYLGQPVWCCDRAFLMLGKEHDASCSTGHAA